MLLLPGQDVGEHRASAASAAPLAQVPQEQRYWGKMRGGGGGTYISPECGRQCREVKGRALKIQTASSKGSLAEELCSLTYIRRSTSAATASPPAYSSPFSVDPTGAATFAPHVLTACGMWEQSSVPWGLLRWPGGSQGREGVAGASTGVHCPESLWLFPSSCPAPGSCQGSRCFGQRHVEGESWLGVCGWM